MRSRSPLGRWTWPAIVTGCAAAALASLAVPSTLGYDPWAWLVWGREVGRWTLDTTGGPSWKPLPVAVTTLLAPLGDVAVPLYTVLARTAGLAAVTAVVVLAVRLGGRWAGVVAGAALVLTPDGDPRFVRLVLEAHEAPLSAGLAVAALAAHLDGRHRRTLALVWLLSLLRPEAWPFLLAHVLWTAGWRVGRPGAARRSARWFHRVEGTNRSSVVAGRGAARRSARWFHRVEGTDRSSVTGWGLAALASVPLLWFVPDWMGSGSVLHGAEAAQVLADASVATRVAEAVGTFAGMVPVPVWALAAVAVVASWRRPGADRAPVVLATTALAWSLLVIAMAVAGGYAAISRFFLPAAAVACVLAGLGALHAASWARHRLRDESSTNRSPVPTAAAVAVAVIVGAVLLVPRIAGIGDVVDEVTERGRLGDDLDATIDAAGGADVLAGCDAAVVTARTLLRSSVAWKLDLPLHAVERSVPGRRAVLLLESARATRLARAAPMTVELAASERWTAFADRCPEVADAAQP